MHSRKICVSVGEPTAKQALDAALLVLGADVIEIRIDYAPELTPHDFVDTLSEKVLFTCRPSWEGGRFTGSEQERSKLLCAAAAAGANYVDLELLAADVLRNQLREKLAEGGGKLLLSSHDFDTTPAEAELFRRVDAMQEAGADLGKLITTANSPDDVLAIFAALRHSQAQGFPLVAFCMGAVGAVSRVGCCDFGSYMTYCSADGAEVTAPGQIAVADMRDIFARYP